MGFSLKRFVKSAVRAAIPTAVAFFTGGPVAAVAVFGLSVASSLLAPTPKQPDFDFTAETRDRNQLIRSSVAPRRLIYGEMVSSGPIVFAASTGTNNKFLHLVIPLAGHECEAIKSVFISDQEVTEAMLDGSGNVTSGRYSGKVRIKKHLGASDQSADSDLVSEVSAWTTNHRLRGVAYIYVRLEFDVKIFPSGLPNIKAVVRGKKVFDTRDSQTRWTRNPALIARDYLMSSDGVGATSAEVDATSITTAANICDEYVTITSVADTFTAATTDIITRATASKEFELGDRVQVSTTGSLPSGLSASTNYFYIPTTPTGATAKLATTLANAIAGTAIDITSTGSGTHTITKNAQLRYTTDGAIKLDRKPVEAMEEIMSSMAGDTVYQAGKYHVFAGAAVSHSASFDDDILAGPIQVRPKFSRRELFNQVRGTFTSPYQFYQETDFPLVTNSGYITADGETITRDIVLPFTIDVTRAQRLAKIILEKSRQSIVVQMTCNYAALNVSVGDVIRLTNSRFGFSNKEFRVLEMEFEVEGGVTITAQEYASAVFDFNAGQETTIDPAPNTTLPDAFTVTAPSIALSDELVSYADGQFNVRLNIALTASTTDFALDQFEVEFKKTSEANFRLVGRGTDLNYEVPNVISGENYTVRARAINAAGVSSDNATATHDVVGELAPPSNVTGFAVNIVGSEAHLTWNAVSDLDLEYYIIRFSTATSGADWPNSVPLVEKVARPATSVTVPARVGSYLIKARDKIGKESAIATVVSTNIVAIGNLNAVASSAQHPDFEGAKSNVVLLDSALQLSGTALIDAASGNFDSATGFFDGSNATSSVASTGTYDFATHIDLGATYTAQVKISPTMSVSDRHTLFDGLSGNFDATSGAFDGDAPSNSSVAFEVATTTDDPSGSATYTDFSSFNAGEFTARAFKFRATLNSLDNKVTPVISALTAEIDLPDRIESDADIVAAASGQAVTFGTTFKTTPAIGISAQGLATGDFYSITSKSATGFSIQFFNSSGTGISRTFDYLAKGF